MSMETPDLAVVPFGGMGEFRFGMTRDEVRALMGSPLRVRRRSPWSRNLTDGYPQLWASFDYTDSGHLEFMEIGEGRCSVSLGEVRLMPGRARDVADRLREHGFATRPADSGLSVVDTGIRLYVPSSEEDAVVKAVSAASRSAGELDIAFFGEPGEAKVGARRTVVSRASVSANCATRCGGEWGRACSPPATRRGAWITTGRRAWSSATTRTAAPSR